MTAIIRCFLDKICPRSRAGHSDLKERVSTRRALPSTALWIFVGAATAFALGWAPPLQRASSTVPPVNVETQERPLSGIEPISPLTGKQKQDLLKSKFEKLKHDADDLFDLAKSLQEEIGKSNENVLSLKVVDKAEKIEKLARKIKAAAKGD